MKKIVTLATAGIFLLSLQSVWAQKEVAPPAVPPMLEGQRPLATPETKEPTAPPKAGEEKAKSAKSKAKGKAKATPKAKSKTTHAKNGKKAPNVAKKKGSKAPTKTKKPAAEPALPATPGGPDEG
jgi:hypothetical protein